MWDVDATQPASPVGQLPKGRRLEGMGVSALPCSVSRTLRVECAVCVSAVSYDRKAALPLRVESKLPACGRFRSEYSMRIGPTIGEPSPCDALGRLAARTRAEGTLSPSHPTSTTV